MERQIDLNPAVETLKEQLENVDEILAQLKEDVARYEAEQTKIEAALKALGESPKPTKKKQGSKKPAPTKSDVLAALRSVQAAGVSGADEIKAAVEREIAKAGFSKAGLSLRLSEVLKEPSQAPL